MCSGLVDVGAGYEVGEFGEQRGVREDRRCQKVGGGLAGGRVAVMPEAARPAGEFVARGFVAGAGLGLLQRAQLAQRLELIGAGRDPGGFAQLGFPGGGCGFGGELGLDDVVGVRVVNGARGCGGEQLRDALPLRELRPAADVVGQVLVQRVLPCVEPGVLEGRRDGANVHALRPAPHDAAADAGGVDRLVGRGNARGERSASTAAGRPHPGHRRPRIRGGTSTRRPPAEPPAQQVLCHTPGPASSASATASACRQRTEAGAGTAYSAWQTAGQAVFALGARHAATGEYTGMPDGRISSTTTIAPRPCVCWVWR
ncbi:hypothetical protein ACFY20_41880 [Streptomyces sp. NPDC001312]|uniref:hypothetical protein n=1 Tax=Streptomyces sp. NPDC001312 TaxID=3364561 RepID=UPI0036B7D951